MVLRSLLFGYVIHKRRDYALESHEAENLYDFVLSNFSSLNYQAINISSPVIICCLKEIKQMEFYLRTGFGESKGSYSGTMLNPFQGLYQGNEVSLEGWFMVIFILILYLIEKGHGFEIKTAITGDYFKLLTMIFFDNGDFPKLVEITDSQWDEVLQKHQHTVYS